MNKNRSTILSILGILSLMLLTIQITYSFFNYTKEGSTENSITTGTITFIYEEVEKNGVGISIENAYPISDEIGKKQTNAGEVFNFKVTSTTINETEIPYTITARKKLNSTLDETAVKLYLTEVNGESEIPLTENIYENLTDYTNRPQGVSEKVLYTTKVPEKSTNYIKNYRLRMWIPTTINFSPVEDNSGNITYPYNDKTFTVTVNVYANTKVITVPTVPISYYSFGLPTTASSTSFLDVITESGSNTFVKLEEEQLSLCIYENEKLECFKNNNYDEETRHLKQIFGENNCNTVNSNVLCSNNNFTCSIDYYGHVSCYTHVIVHSCTVYSSGSVDCHM